MTWFLHILGTLWCLPATILVWLFYILPMWLAFKDIQFEGWDGPLVARFRLDLDDPTIEPWHLRWWMDWAGIGLPNAYIYRDDSQDRFDDWQVPDRQAHERRHVMQWFVFGPLFIVAYGIGIVIGSFRGGGYMMNPLEIDARKAEKR